MKTIRRWQASGGRSRTLTRCVGRWQFGTQRRFRTGVPVSDMTALQQVQPWLGNARWVDCAPASDAIGFRRVHTDSRSIEPGDLFVALRGERFDATDFLAQAKARGAVAAICQDSQTSDAQAKLQAAGLPGLVVADARLALTALAARW